MKTMTDIIISGANGHMGHMIYECIKDRSDCQVVAGIDINTEKYADFPIFATPSELNVKGDVIIDFSHPALLDALLEYSSKTGTPVVYATTGYTGEHHDKIQEAAEPPPVCV